MNHRSQQRQDQQQLLLDGDKDDEDADSQDAANDGQGHNSIGSKKYKYKNTKYNLNILGKTSYHKSEQMFWISISFSYFHSLRHKFDPMESTPRNLAPTPKRAAKTRRARGGRGPR